MVDILRDYPPLALQHRRQRQFNLSISRCYKAIEEATCISKYLGLPNSGHCYGM